MRRFTGRRSEIVPRKTGPFSHSVASFPVTLGGTGALACADVSIGKNFLRLSNPHVETRHVASHPCQTSPHPHSPTPALAICIQSFVSVQGPRMRLPISLLTLSGIL